MGRLIVALLLSAIAIPGCAAARSALGVPKSSDSSVKVRTGETYWLLVKNPRFGDTPAEPEYVWVDENKVPWTFSWGVPGRAALAPPEIVAKYGPPPFGGKIGARQGTVLAANPVAATPADVDRSPLPHCRFTPPPSAPPSPSSAEVESPRWATIDLTSGQRVQGGILKITEAAIVIDIAGQPLTIAQEKIARIEFGRRGSTTAPDQRLAEALAALSGLRSVTGGSVTYRDYAPRVSDAKIVVDRYLSSEGGNNDAKRSVCEAMHYYILASSAWNAKISSSGYDSIGLDPGVSRCDALQSLRSTVRGSRVLGLATETGIAIAVQGVPSLWACASHRLDEALRLAGPSRGRQ